MWKPATPDAGGTTSSDRPRSSPRSCSDTTRPVGTRLCAWLHVHWHRGAGDAGRDGGAASSAKRGSPATVAGYGHPTRGDGRRSPPCRFGSIPTSHEGRRSTARCTSLTTGPASVAARVKGRLEDRLQNLEYGPLNPPINHVRDAQTACPPPGLGSQTRGPRRPSRQTPNPGRGPTRPATSLAGPAPVGAIRTI